MKPKIYVGIVRSGSYRVFKSATTLTKASHGSEYISVVGPFRTMRGAVFHAMVGRGNNPHVQSVSDAERIARAVNAHDDLVAALEAALHWGSWDGMGPHPTSCPTTGAALSTKNCVPDRDNQGRTNT